MQRDDLLFCSGTINFLVIFLLAAILAYPVAEVFASDFTITYVRTDKDNYTAGETIKLEIIVRSESGYPTPENKLLLCLLFNESAKIYEKDVTISFKPKETKKVNVSINIPETAPEGIYRIDVWLKTAANVLAAYGVSNTFYIASKYKGVIEVSPIMIYQGERFGSGLWGHHFEKNKTITFNFTIYNRKSTESNIFINAYITPTFESEKIWEINAQEELRPYENKTISLNYTPQKAGSFTLVVKILDGENEFIRSARFVIEGVSGSIQDVRNLKAAYKEGEAINLTVIVAGPADYASVISNGYLDFYIYKGERVVLNESKYLGAIKGDNNMYIFSFEAPEDLEKYKLKVVLRNGNEILDTWEANYEGTLEKKEETGISPILLFLIVALCLIFIGIKMVKRKNFSKVGPLVLLFLVLSVFLTNSIYASDYEVKTKDYQTYNPKFMCDKDKISNNPNYYCTDTTDPWICCKQSCEHVGENPWTLNFDVSIQAKEPGKWYSEQKHTGTLIGYVAACTNGFSIFYTRCEIPALAYNFSTFYTQLGTLDFRGGHTFEIKLPSINVYRKDVTVECYGYGLPVHHWRFIGAQCYHCGGWEYDDAFETCVIKAINEQSLNLPSELRIWLPEKHDTIPQNSLLLEHFYLEKGAEQGNPNKVGASARHDSQNWGGCYECDNPGYRDEFALDVYQLLTCMYNWEVCMDNANHECGCCGKMGNWYYGEPSSNTDSFTITIYRSCPDGSGEWIAKETDASPYENVACDNGVIKICDSSTNGTIISIKKHEYRWWDLDWNYRTFVVDAYGDNYDYQAKLIVDTQSLISAGKMRSDCGDIRFVVYKDPETFYQIPYWIESGCNTSNTVIWIRVPKEGGRIYMYYGNPSASSIASADQVFYAYWDFSSNSDYETQMFFANGPRGEGYTSSIGNPAGSFYGDSCPFDSSADSLCEHSGCSEWHINWKVPPAAWPPEYAPPSYIRIIFDTRAGNDGGLVLKVKTADGTWHTLYDQCESGASWNTKFVDFQTTSPIEVIRFEQYGCGGNSCNGEHRYVDNVKIMRCVVDSCNGLTVSINEEDKTLNYVGTSKRYVCLSLSPWRWISEDEKETYKEVCEAFEGSGKWINYTTCTVGTCSNCCEVSEDFIADNTKACDNGVVSICSNAYCGSNSDGRCNKTVVIGATTYYCVNDGSGWKWSTNSSSGSYSDNNCYPGVSNDEDIDCCLESGNYWDDYSPNINNKCCESGDVWCNALNGTCQNGVWYDNHCKDNMLDCNEIEVDCGGECKPCVNINVVAPSPLNVILGETSRIYVKIVNNLNRKATYNVTLTYPSSKVAVEAPSVVEVDPNSVTSIYLKIYGISAGLAKVCFRVEEKTNPNVFAEKNISVKVVPPPVHSGPFEVQTAPGLNVLAILQVIFAAIFIFTRKILRFLEK